MASKLEVMNIALTLLGEPTADDPDDSSENPTTIRDLFDMARDAVLADHPWNFAMEYAAVAASDTTPTVRYDYAYPLPQNPYCLRVWQVIDQLAAKPDLASKWEVQGRSILTDLGSPLYFSFIKRVTEPGLWSPGFAFALGLRLAAFSAYKITGKSGREEALMKHYKDFKTDGKAQDGQEGAPDDVETDEFDIARL
ncbi:MAG: hypothetical protein U1A72_13295 [Sulfuritalea sp.]|nr:hypothetical protein [Sulfuritalea sp.]